MGIREGSCWLIMDVHSSAVRRLEMVCTKCEGDWLGRSRTDSVGIILMFKVMISEPFTAFHGILPTISECMIVKYIKAGVRRGLHCQGQTWCSHA